MKVLSRVVERVFPGGVGKGMAGSASLVLGVQVAGAGLTYLYHVLLARLLGASEYGVYAYVMAWVALVVPLVGLGFNTSLVRLIPEYVEQEKRRLLKGVVLRSWQLVSLLAFSLAGIGTVAISAFGLGDAVQYRSALFIGLWIIPLQALLDLQSSMARGLKRMTLAYAPNRLGQTGLFVVSLCVCILLEINVDRYLALALAGGSIAGVMLPQARVVWNEIAGLCEGLRAEYKTREWLGISIPMVLISGFMILLARTDVVMLGMFSTADSVGVFNVASRTAYAASFVLVAVNAIGGPTIASVYHGRGREELQELTSGLAHFAFWPTLGVVILLVLFAPTILGLFGAEFIRAESLLYILLLGHLVNVGAGSVGYLLNMTGYQQVMAWVVGIVAVVNIILNALAIPKFGALGAAAATSISMAVWNLWLNRIVASRLSVRPSIVYAVRSALSSGREEQENDRADRR